MPTVVGQSMDKIIFSQIEISDLRKMVHEELTTFFEQHKACLVSMNDSDNLLTVQQAADLLAVTEPTIYSYVGKANIPHYRLEKRLYFLKSDLIEWIKTFKRKTNTEIGEDAARYMASSRKLTPANKRGNKTL